MIVQHTGKECKTKFSIGMEFKNSFIENKKTKNKYLTGTCLCDNIYGQMEVGLFFMPKN